VLIAGPTASGKSAAALALAEEAGRRGREAWIVNADAMQVYDALRILTARPSPAEEAHIPHRLYGHVSAATRYSVGAWLADVEQVLAEADRTGALVIAVGGTGLYLMALTQGIAAIPPVPPEVHSHWATRMQAEGVEALHAELAARDPESAAAIRPVDTQRVLRALEVLEATGVGLGAWQTRGSAPPLVPPDAGARLVLDAARPVLHARIEERFDRMVDEGAIEEVRALLARRLDPELPAMKAIGVRELSAVLREEMSLADAIAKAKTETRRYAKRQTTWLRNRMADWPRLAGRRAETRPSLPRPSACPRRRSQALRGPRAESPCRDRNRRDG
jgi:tRNA dimethylallyltransferase